MLFKINEDIFKQVESDYQTIKINNDLGEAIILYGSNAIKKSLKLLGYDSEEEIETVWEKKLFQDTVKKIKPEIILLSWRSKEINNGFGRFVIRYIFDLANNYNLNKFRISLPSKHALKILNNYIEKGNLKPNTEYQSGLSVDPYYTEFFLVKKP